MSLVQKDVRITTLWASTAVYQQLPPCILYAVTLTPRDSNLRPTQCHGLISLRTPDVSQNDISIVLASGYFGSHNPLSWTGKIPITAEEFIHGLVMAPNNATIRITALIVTPKPGQTAMELLDA